ncbi:MAG: ribosomal protein S18-alanine N-acetyltransferase [Clostridia bacterium]|nr:ribosomal protein S18-alanine N-acetyltransferase [Clostridia bacterium]
MIRHFERTDLFEIEEIERECFRVPYAEKMLESSFSAPTFFGLLDKDKEIKGYVFATVVLDEANIDRVAVREKYRSHKVATNLLKEAEKQFKNKGVNSVYLEVRRSNEHARHLYEHLGYMVVGVREKYYEGVEDAFVMLKNI